MTRDRDAPPLDAPICVLPAAPGGQRDIAADAPP
jgi:hypothetical protein